jgi:uncharacterized membrane protein YfcA
MSTFDKVCACVAIPIGFVFMFLGVIGVFLGSSAHFTLPPILGGIPFFLGWAMSITLIRFWSSGKADHDDDLRDADRAFPQFPNPE